MADANLIGYEYPPYTFPVERGKIREFARAVRDDDPACRDGATAPLTFSAVTGHWAPQRTDVLGLDLRRVLAGGAEWEYLGEIRAGDELTVSSRIADVVHKTGSRGGMTLIITEHSFVNQRGETVLRQRSTAIELDAT